MKLHLPKGLRAALLACFSVVIGYTTLGSGAYADNVISVNFGLAEDKLSDKTFADTDTLGGVKAAGWVDICGNLSKVNATHDVGVYDTVGGESGTGAFVEGATAKVTVDAPQAPYSPGAYTAGTTTLAQAVADGYLDLHNKTSNVWTINVTSDFLLSDLTLYLSGDGGNYTPVLVNGTRYIGGETPNTEAGNETSWGTRSYDDGPSELKVNGVVGGSYTMQNVGAVGYRATLAGMQVTDRTDTILWVAPAGETVDATTASFTLGDASKTLADIDAAARYLGFSNQTVQFGTGVTTLAAIQASSGTVTVTAQEGGSINPGILLAKSGSTLDVQAAFAEGSTVTVYGSGQVKFSGGGSVGTFTNNGNALFMEDMSVSQYALSEQPIKVATGKTLTIGNEGNIYIDQGGNYNLLHLLEASDISDEGFAGTVRLVGNFSAHSDSGSLSKEISGNYLVDGGTLTINSAGNMGVTLVAGASLNATNGGVLEFKRNATFLVDGGTVDAGLIKIGHEELGDYPGTMRIQSGLVKVDSINLQNNNSNADMGSIFEMLGGELQFKQSANVAFSHVHPNAQIRLLGGTLSTASSGWFTQGANLTFGEVTLAGSGVGKDITILGGTSTLVGTLTNNLTGGAKFQLKNALVANALEDFELKSISGYSEGANGFAIADYWLVKAGEGAHTVITDTITLNGAEMAVKSDAEGASSADGYLTTTGDVYFSSTGTGGAYYVNEDVTFTSSNIASVQQAPLIILRDATMTLQDSAALMEGVTLRSEEVGGVLPTIVFDGLSTNCDSRFNEYEGHVVMKGEGATLTVSDTTVDHLASVTLQGGAFFEHTGSSDANVAITIEKGDVSITGGHTQRGQITLAAADANTVAGTIYSTAAHTALGGGIAGTGSVTIKGNSTSMDVYDVLDFTGNLTLANGVTDGTGKVTVRNAGNNCTVCSITNTGNIIIESGVTVVAEDGSTIANTGDVIINGGTLSAVGNFNIGGNLVLNAGSASIGRGPNATHTLRLGDVTMESGTQLELHHQGVALTKADGTLSSITMKGATLRSEDMADSATSLAVGHRWGTLSLSGNNSIVYGQKSRMNFEKLTTLDGATADLAISGGNNTDAEKYYTEFPLIENYNGTIANGVHSKVYVNTVNQAQNYSLAITGGILSSDFKKTGAGSLSVDSLTILEGGKLTMNHEGALTVTSVALSNNAVLSYTGVGSVLALGADAFGGDTSLTGLTFDLSEIDDITLLTGIDSGISTALTDLSCFNLDNCSLVDGGNGRYKIMLPGAENSLSWTDKTGGTWVDSDTQQSGDWSKENTNPTGKLVLFDSDGVDAGGTTTITISGTVTPSQVYVSNAAGTTYVFTGTSADGIGGESTSLSKSGDGTLTISLANAYGGGTTVKAGVLNATVAGALGTGDVLLSGHGKLVQSVSLGNTMVFGGGTLAYAGSADAITALGASLAYATNATEANVELGTDTAAQNATWTFENTDASKAILNGGNLSVSGNGKLTLGGTIGGTIGTGKTLTISGETAMVEVAASSTIAHQLAGTGTLRLASAGGISGDNRAFEGTIELANGTGSHIQFHNANATGGEKTTLHLNGTKFYGPNNSVFGAGTILMDGSNVMDGSSGQSYTFSGNFKTADSIGADTVEADRPKLELYPAATVKFLGTLNEFAGILSTANRGGDYAFEFGNGGEYAAAGNIFKDGTILRETGAANSLTVKFNYGNESVLNLNALVEGDTLLEQNGTGTIALTKNNTATGALSVNSGTLAIGTADAAASWAGAINVNNEGVLELVNVKDNTVSSAITAAAGATIKVTGYTGEGKLLTLTSVTGGKLDASGQVLFSEDASIDACAGSGTVYVATGKTLTLRTQPANADALVSALATLVATDAYAGKFLISNTGTIAEGAGTGADKTISLKGNYQIADDWTTLQTSGINKLSHEGSMSVNKLVLYKNQDFSVNGGTLNLLTGSYINQGSTLSLISGAITGGEVKLESDSAAFSMTGGTLSLSNSLDGSSAKSVSLTGGTLATLTDDPDGWSIKGPVTLGAVTIAAANTADITVNGATTFAGTVDNDGKLVLNGALSVQEGATLQTETISGGRTSGNGFAQSTAWLVDATGATATLTLGSGALTVTDGGQTYTVTADNGSLTYIKEASSGIYYVNEGTVIYGGADSAMTIGNVTGLQLSGGNLTLASGLDAETKSIALKENATITLGDGVSLAASALTADAGKVATVAGTGTYKVTDADQLRSVTMAGATTLDLSTTGTMALTSSTYAADFAGTTAINSGTVEIGSAMTTLGNTVTVANGATLSLVASGSIANSAISSAGKVTMAGTSSISGLTGGSLEIAAGATASSSADISVGSFVNNGSLLSLGNNNLTMTQACGANGGNVTANMVTIEGAGTAKFGRLTASVLDSVSAPVTIGTANIGVVKLHQKMDPAGTPFVTVTTGYTTTTDLTIYVDYEALPTPITSADENTKYTLVDASAAGPTALDGLNTWLNVVESSALTTPLNTDTYKNGTTIYEVKSDGETVYLSVRFDENVLTWAPTDDKTGDSLNEGTWEAVSSGSEGDFTGNQQTVAVTANVLFSGGGTGEDSGATGKVNVKGDVTVNSITVNASAGSDAPTYTFSSEEGSLTVSDKLIILKGDIVVDTDLTVVGMLDADGKEIVNTGSITMGAGSRMDSIVGSNGTCGAVEVQGDQVTIDKMVEATTFTTIGMGVEASTQGVTVGKLSSDSVTAKGSVLNAEKMTTESVDAQGSNVNVGTLTGTGENALTVSATSGSTVVVKELVADNSLAVTMDAGSTLEIQNSAGATKALYVTKIDGAANDATDPTVTGSTFIAQQDVVLLGQASGHVQVNSLGVEAGAAGSRLESLTSTSADNKMALTLNLNGSTTLAEADAAAGTALLTLGGDSAAPTQTLEVTLTGESLAGATTFAGSSYTLDYTFDNVAGLGTSGTPDEGKPAYTVYTLLATNGLYNVTLDKDALEAIQQEFALNKSYADFWVDAVTGDLKLTVYDDSDRVWSGGDFSKENESSWAGDPDNNGGKVLNLSKLDAYAALDTVPTLNIDKATTIDLTGDALAAGDTDGLLLNDLSSVGNAASLLLKGDGVLVGDPAVDADGDGLADVTGDLVTLNNTKVTTFASTVTAENITVQVVGKPAKPGDAVTLNVQTLTLKDAALDVLASGDLAAQKGITASGSTIDVLAAGELTSNGQTTLQNGSTVTVDGGTMETAGLSATDSAVVVKGGASSSLDATAGATTLTDSTLMVMDGASATLGDATVTSSTLGAVGAGTELVAGKVTLADAAAHLASADGANLTVDSLMGTAGMVSGSIKVSGTGGSYSGKYGANAAVDVLAGAGQELTVGGESGSVNLALAAGEGAQVTLNYTSGDAVVKSLNTNGAAITLNNNVSNTLTATETSTVTGGSLGIKINALDAVAANAPQVLSGVNVSGTTVIVGQADSTQNAVFDLSNGSEGWTLFTLTDGSAENVTVKLDPTSTFFSRYFDLSSVTVENGVVKADLVTDYYASQLGESENGSAGLKMIDTVDLMVAPTTGDLAKVIKSLDEYTKPGSDASAADKLGAAVAGAGTASLGMALAGDMERQLKAIRNRTTTMGVDPMVVNEDMPYFNAWINAEGDHRSLDQDSTLAGYTLTSWGGTVGFDMDVNPNLTWGLALTAMYADFTAESADQVEGDVHTYYVSAFARAMSGAWVHTFVATLGLNWADVNRSITHASGSYTTSGDADGMSFGLLYEVGRTYALNEDGSACWQPVFNVAYRHVELDGYEETGSDAALSVGDQSMDTVTFGLGGRLQAVVGENIYNRSSIFEARALVKFDAGDRESEVETEFLGASVARGTVKSAEMDAFGVELGAGLTIPVGMDGGSIFMDGSVEFRGSYTSANGTFGYRVNF